MTVERPNLVVVPRRKPVIVLVAVLLVQIDFWLSCRGNEMKPRWGYRGSGRTRRVRPVQKRSVNTIENFQLTISQNIRSRFSTTPPSSSLSA